MTMSPTSDAGIMPACGSSREHETGKDSSVRHIKSYVFGSSVGLTFLSIRRFVEFTFLSIRRFVEL